MDVVTQKYVVGKNPVRIQSIWRLFSLYRRRAIPVYMAAFQSLSGISAIYFTAAYPSLVNMAAFQFQSGISAKYWITKATLATAIRTLTLSLLFDFNF